LRFALYLSALAVLLAAFLGCARPQALAPAAPKRVYVNLESLLPLHPSYSLLMGVAEAEPLSRPELLPAAMDRRLTQTLPSPPGPENWAAASTISEPFADDRAANLVGLRTVLNSRRRAGTDLLEEKFAEQERQASLPLAGLTDRLIHEQMTEVVALLARLASPDLSAEARTTTEQELKALRASRAAYLQSQQRKTALELAKFWSAERLAIERELASFDTSTRQGADADLASRSKQAEADSQVVEAALRTIASPRQSQVSQQMTILTTVSRPPGAPPASGFASWTNDLSCLRREVAAAVEQVAAQNFWAVSFRPRYAAEDVTVDVRRILSAEFYPKMVKG